MKRTSLETNSLSLSSVFRILTADLLRQCNSRHDFHHFLWPSDRHYNILSITIILLYHIGKIYEIIKARKSEESQLRLRRSVHKICKVNLINGIIAKLLAAKCVF